MPPLTAWRRGGEMGFRCNGAAAPSPFLLGALWPLSNGKDTVMLLEQSKDTRCCLNMNYICLKKFHLEIKKRLLNILADIPISQTTSLAV